MGGEYVDMRREYVLNGKGREGYREEDGVDGKRIYGKRKRVGEEVIGLRRKERRMMRRWWV
ncbi:sugar nucleotide-binding protein [Bacillus subtilis]|uniref:sugar nucleotide-binding protein n=1 Tax=Bacillus subtilis TaxID=1423 RepID=UPI00119C9414|nr:sugar nucleotide-binding protein [Bacillus subtilis]